MIRRPPRSTRTDTLFPYTTLFRSTILLRGSATRPSRRSSMPLLKEGELAEDHWTALAESADAAPLGDVIVRSEEHTSELQSLMRISYAVFCLKKKKQRITTT